MPIIITSSTTQGHNKCRRHVWNDVPLECHNQPKKKKSIQCLLQKGIQLPRVRSTSHLRHGSSSCCLHHLPPFTPVSSLCHFTSWLMLHSHYPESCCWLLRLHPLSYSHPLSLISHFCPLSVIAFALLDFHSLFSSHALQRSITSKKTNPPFENCDTKWWVK